MSLNPAQVQRCSVPACPQHQRQLAPEKATPKYIAVHRRRASPCAAPARYLEKLSAEPSARLPPEPAPFRPGTPADTAPQQFSRSAPPSFHESSDYYGRAQVALRCTWRSYRLVNAETQPLNGARAEAACGIPRAFIVGIDQDTVHLHVAGGNLEACRQAVQEFRDDTVAVHADHTAVRSGHANVGDVGRALGENVLVRRRDMRVRAHHRADAPIEIPAHRQFLAAGFRMHVHQNESNVSGNSR